MTNDNLRLADVHFRAQQAETALAERTRQLRDAQNSNNELRKELDALRAQLDEQQARISMLHNKWSV